MFTATMEYQFKKDQADRAAELWEKEVFSLAKTQKGFLRMEFFLRDGGQALALGVWETEDDAQAFMRTGVFKTLMNKLQGLCEGDPRPGVWKLLYSQ